MIPTSPPGPNAEPLLEALGMAALTVDDRGTIVWVSERMRALLGISGQRLEGRPLIDLGLPFEDERLWDPTENRLRPIEEAWEGHLVRNIGQGEAPLVVTLHPLGAGGPHLVIFRPAHQVAPPLPDGFVEIQRLACLGRLTGTFAHDFNNTLVGLVGGVAMLQTHLASDKEGLEILEILESANTRAQTLVQQILGYAVSVESRRTEIDLSQLARDTLKPLRPLLRPHCTVHLDLADGLPPAHVEPVPIQQVIINLVLNALDALPAGGDIHVSTLIMRSPPSPLLRLATAHPLLALTVRDSGHGIALDDLERIFEPRHSTHGSGHGLGLAASQAIARRFGGEITVRSQPGEGSAFTLWLPTERRSDPRPDSEEGNMESISAREGECVLIIDDEKIVRTMASQMLRRLGYEVIEVAGAREALQELTSDDRRVDLAIIDMVMPEVDGRQALRQLREVRPDLKAVLTSGYFDTFSEDLLTLEGFVGFISKPYRLQSFGRAVREALDR